MQRFLQLAATAALLALGAGGCTFEASGDEGVSHQFGSDHFGVGAILNVTDPVAGDAFLVAGQVSTAAEIGGDLVAAGGEVSVGGNVGDDLYAAGGTVKVDAIVNGNARVAGGDVSVGPATVIAGSAAVSGGRVAFEGNTHGYLKATGGTVTLSGQVHKDAEVRAEDLVISPETRIAGRLVYHGPTAPEVPEGAVIAGGVEFHEVSPGTYLHETSSPVRRAAHWVGSVLWHLGVFCVGALFVILLPGISSRAADTLRCEPLVSMGLGLGLLVCVPIVLVMLCITVIGIPLALLLGTGYLLALFLGWIVVALFVGERGLSLVRGSQPVTTGLRLLALLLALVGLSYVRHIPYLGGLVVFLALIAGMGALVWQGWTRRPGAGSARVTA
ncbi:MAG TPA: hypothetical protein PL152_05970 [Steroidobacteraceae bacterium]|nr:hypothetical protein [Steroidobacteraceae bacterium]